MYAQVIVDIVHENVAHTFTYAVPEGLALTPGQRVAVPFGPRRLEGIVLALTETCELPPEKVRPVLEALEPYPAVLPALIDLAQHMADDAHCPLAETLRLMLPAEMRGGRVHVKEQPVARLAIPPEQVPEAVAAQGRSVKRRTLLQLLQGGSWRPVGDLAMLVRDPLPSLRQLRDAGLVELDTREILRRPGGGLQTDSVDPPLMDAQREVLEELIPAAEAGRGRFLLHGVTGSGKTEVFIRLVRHVLAMGKGAMILVPEIALTPQMVGWFRSRFGEVAAVLHSRLSAGERFDEWRRIRRGDARVVIGARSAVFAPVERLGLIVVDEEHETTYQSDRHPRYDARDVAAWRCEREGGTLLLASATPSILSFSRAREGKYRLLEMPHRVMDRPLPEVEIVDMRRELTLGNRSVFSQSLQKALRQCMARGGQAMLLMNHRGYNSFVSCRSCGYVVKCSQCDVSMTYHVGGADSRLHCHYCGATALPPETCPQCGSRYIRYFGAGTQKVEEELRQMFPETGIVRMDIDTTGGKDGHAKLLDEFRSGRARLLVGTQMIAKGLDFPRVTLVGVIAADLSLNLPDYRARERTFQLLTQVAGRAGRGDTPGQVIIQTYKPDDATIQSAAAQDYRGFYAQEIAHRRMGLYPPFTVMARLLVEARLPGDAQRTAENLSEALDGLLAEQPELGQCVLLRTMDQPSVKLLRGRHRWHILMKLWAGDSAEALCAKLNEMARAQTGPAEVYFEYNPTTMM